MPDFSELTRKFIRKIAKYVIIKLPLLVSFILFRLFIWANAFSSQIFRLFYTTFCSLWYTVESYVNQPKYLQELKMCLFNVCIYKFTYILLWRAIQRWPEWDLNPWPLNSVQILQLSYQAMSSSRTHIAYIYTIYDLIAQSVRASERNSVAVGSNPTQANFLQLLQIILQWWIPYVSTHSATLMWLPQQNFD